MENRCGGEKESEMRREERKEGSKRWMLLPARLKSKPARAKVCVSACVRPDVRRAGLTVRVRVAVEALAGRSAAEV